MRFTRFIKSFSFILVLVCLFSCQETAPTNGVPDSFFDLKSYFENENNRLQTINQISKSVTIDGKVEEQILNNVSLKEELSLFKDSDINKVSWLDKYEVDSLFNGEDLSEIKYQAKDEKMKTNQLHIFFNAQKVDSIRILRKTSSIAAELEQDLVYIPASGYSIISRQKTKFSEAHTLKLEVKFLSNSISN